MTNSYDLYHSRGFGGAVGNFDIGPIFRLRHRQEGRGLGNFFSSIFKYISPYILSASKAVGKEALRSGTEFISDIGSKPLTEIFSEQKKKVLGNLTQAAENKLRKMREGQSGLGLYKRRRKNISNVIRNLVKVKRGRKRGRKKSTKVKRKTTKRRKSKKSLKRLQDIFG